MEPQPNCGFDPDAATGARDNPLTDGEAHSASGIFPGCLEALEESKNLFVVAWLNSDAVVLYREHPAIGPARGGNPDLGRQIAAIANRIRDEILKNEFELTRLHGKMRQLRTRN